MSTSGGIAGAVRIGNVWLQPTGGPEIGGPVPYSGDSQATGLNELPVVARMEAFNGALIDRLRTLSAANLAAQSGIGGLIASEPGSWSVVSATTAGGQATASRVAGGAGVRHVATGILVSAEALVAPAATEMNVLLRDGATGVGTVLSQFDVLIPAAIGQSVPPIMVLLPNVVGGAATAMTLEFSNLVANLRECVTLYGFDAS